MISDQNSDILEDSIFEIIGDFDTAQSKPSRKTSGHKKVSTGSKITAESLNIHKNDFNFQNNEEDIIVSNKDSFDLEKEISQVMNVMDTDKAEVGVKSVSKQESLIDTDRGTTRFDVPPVVAHEQKRKKKKDVPSSVTRELDQQISEIMLEIEFGEKEDQKKNAPELSRPISATEFERSSDAFNGIGGKKDLEKEGPDVIKGFEKQEVTVSQFQPTSVPERTKSERDDLTEKEEIHTPFLDSQDSAEKTVQPPIELISKTLEPKHKILPKQDPFSFIDEVDKAKDSLRDSRQEQDLKFEMQFTLKDSRENEKQVFHPKHEPEPDKLKLKRDERFEADEKHVSMPGRNTIYRKSLQSTVKSVPKIKKQQDIHTEAPPQKESKDQKLGTGEESLNSEKKPEKTETQKSVKPDKFGAKRSTNDEIVITLADLDRLIELYQDESLSEKAVTLEDTSEQKIKKSGELEIQDVIDVKPDSREPRVMKEELVLDSHKSSKLEDGEADDSFLQEFSGDPHFSYLNLEDLDESVIETTTELDMLIKESNTNQFMDYIENYYKSVGEDERIAVINTEVFYLWCMMEAVFEFSLESEFRKNLIMFFNARVGELYLKWKEFTLLNIAPEISIDFNNFSYYSNQVRANKINLNSSFQNTDAEILFGKIVLTKIHEFMGDKKLDVEIETILMPVKVYYELKNRVVEILNRTTNMICY